MKVINNKKIITIIVGGLLLIIVGGLLIWNLNSANKTKLEEVSLKNDKVDSNMFAIMLEEIDEEGNSTYVESSDNMWPSLKYKYNTTNSGCLDVNGTSIPDILSYDAKNQKAIVRTKSVAYCYLYFDIDESVYAKVRNDYTDNNGALLLNETESDEYPVYYYNGNITNNNILYGNFCWKMVRTTETGGVKLIYNGVPDKGEDGTLTCDNTGEESQIGTSKFNSSYNSLAYFGYMYNTVYKYSTNGYTANTNVLTNSWMSTTASYIYYYGDKAVWNEETGKYDLKVSSDEGDIDVTETTTWSSDTYSSLVGKYTCRNTTATSCATVYYIAGASSSYMYNYGISGGKTKDDYKIKLATSVTDNGDGTYTLVDPIEVIKKDWYTSYSDYKNYYYCSDLISDTCGASDTRMYYSALPSDYRLSGVNISSVYKYGNSFEPGETEGTYKLVDTKEFWNWPENYNQINNHHYTCFNATGECTEVKYIYHTDSSAANYITLKDGKTIETALNEMLYVDDVNTIDSTIKDYIDTWYKGAILDKTDSSDKLYSTYLEDTIWCNNREINNLAGWNPNGGDTTKYLYFNTNLLECANETDQFTLKAEAGGTEGYGNNALDYPIGLLTYKEAYLANSYGYLKSGNSYWLLSPNSFGHGAGYGSFLNSDGSLASKFGLTYAHGVRPAVSLSTSVEITSGDGSVTTPYQVILPS